MSSDVSSSPSAAPPFQPEAAFVELPERFDDYAAPAPGELEERARAVLVDRLGATDASIAAAYACGTLGVQADQTHYSDGFGLLMPLQQGIAVAARRADESRIVFEESDQTWTTEASALPPWATALHCILQELLADQQAEVAVTSTIPGVCRDAYLAALAVALMRAVRALDMPTTVDLDSVPGLRDDLVPLLAGEIGTALDRPYSTAYLLATFAGPDPAFTLVDTSTREHLPVETEGRTALRWAVLDPGSPEPRPPAFHRHRKRQADEALSMLRRNGFSRLTAVRDLEHRDLERATDVLPAELGPVARHLVTENRRVQKHVAALRRSDWQMIGALLLMSHASQRDDWTGTSAAADAVVNEAERRTHDGLYGACMTGRSGAVLVTGRPNNFRQGLRHLLDAVEPTLGHAPRLLAP
jgi:galactokinase